MASISFAAPLPRSRPADWRARQDRRSSRPRARSRSRSARAHWRCASARALPRRRSPRSAPGAAHFALEAFKLGLGARRFRAGSFRPRLAPLRARLQDLSSDASASRASAAVTACPCASASAAFVRLSASASAPNCLLLACASCSAAAIAAARPVEFGVGVLVLLAQSPWSPGWRPSSLRGGFQLRLGGLLRVLGFSPSRLQRFEPACAPRGARRQRSPCRPERYSRPSATDRRLRDEALTGLQSALAGPGLGLALDHTDLPETARQRIRACRRSG